MKIRWFLYSENCFKFNKSTYKQYQYLVFTALPARLYHRTATLSDNKIDKKKKKTNIHFVPFRLQYPNRSAFAVERIKHYLIPPYACVQALFFNWSNIPSHESKKKKLNFHPQDDHTYNNNNNNITAANDFARLVPASLEPSCSHNLPSLLISRVSSTIWLLHKSIYCLNDGIFYLLSKYTYSCWLWMTFFRRRRML